MFFLICTFILIWSVLSGFKWNLIFILKTFISNLISFLLRREKGNDLFNSFHENDLSFPLSQHEKQGKKFIFFSYCFVQVSFGSWTFYFMTTIPSLFYLGFLLSIYFYHSFHVSLVVLVLLVLKYLYTCSQCGGPAVWILGYNRNQQSN